MKAVETAMEAIMDLTRDEPVASIEFLPPGNLLVTVASGSEARVRELLPSSMQGFPVVVEAGSRVIAH